MQLYLHWGLNPYIQTEIDYYFELLKQILDEQSPRQVLHLPFARTGIYAENREITQPLFIKPFVEWLGIEYLDGRHLESYDKVNNPMIFMSGWNDNENLYNQIINHDFLHKLVINASCIVGDSAWAIVCGKAVFNAPSFAGYASPGLSIIEAVIIPHYTQYGLSKEETKNIMKWVEVSKCFAIDENTVVKTTSENISDLSDQRPDYQIFWKGQAQLIRL